MDSIKKEEMGKSAVKAGLWYTIGNIALVWRVPELYQIGIS